MGNVVGSNIFNITMILGVAAVLQPLHIQGNTVRLEWPVMMLAALQLHLLSRDGTLDRLEGGFLLLGLCTFLAYVVWLARTSAVPAELQQYQEAATKSGLTSGARAWLLHTSAAAGGIAILTGGASALVSGSVSIATLFGVSDAVIGLTIVAAGTSLPELAASAVAAYRGKADIAVGNIVGSNIFNALGIAGATALVHPLPVPTEIIVRDNWWMVAVSALLLPIMRTGMRISRLEGALLLGIFAVYLTLLLRGI